MKEYSKILTELEEEGSLRSLPEVEHNGKYIIQEGRQMLNLSSNDYLGLASRHDLRSEYMDWVKDTNLPFSSSSSRLLTGNFQIYAELEESLSERFGREASLVFNSGWHANTGILSALADKQTLIVADKLVHASIIDGILLKGTPFRRYRHNDYDHLETILEAYAAKYEQVFVVTESIFSMDGDVADLRRLVEIRAKFPNLVLYVDEAHAIGVRGATGLGVAEEQGCIQDIDLLVGTFGKALASLGAYLICNSDVREYLINTMRPLIFSTALPPIQVAWTKFIFDRLPSFDAEREQLNIVSNQLRTLLNGHGGEMSGSHIVPFIVGENDTCLLKAEELQRKGFYCLAVRPPTVPKGTSRIRFSLTSAITPEEIASIDLNSGKA